VALSSPPDFGETGAMGAAPWSAAWAAPSRSKGPHLANRQLLGDLDVKRNFFAHLWWLRWTEEGWRRGGGSGNLQRRWGRPLAAL
jgi:hypothetical protein